ncbi:hypothetical protein J3A83DRAFT_4186394 [Scleroderma citrinum]
MTDSHGLYPTLAAVSLVLDAADIIATATGVIKAKLYGLQENPNAHYWREVVHVVWEQLIYKIMHGEVEQVAMMDKGKGKAVNPLFGCGEDVTMPSDVHASNDTGQEHRGQTRSCLACREQHSHRIHGHYIAAINSPPDGFSIVEEGQSQAGLAGSVIAGIKQQSPQVLLANPSPSVAANTGSTPPTTPSSTGSAGGDNTARIDTLEAKVLVLKKELVVKSHQLDDTQCKVSSLHDIVEALQQEHYPLAQGLMCPIHHTTTPQPGPMLPSTCHAITPAMVTPLGYTQQVDLALTTMVEEGCNNSPPTPASIEDAPTHTDGATAPDAPLVPVTLAIIVSTLDDAVLIGSGEDNGANDMHVD